MPRRSIYLGIAWRAAAWSLFLGTLIGTVYAGAYGLFLIPLQATFILAFAKLGAQLGAIAGAVAAVVNATVLTTLTALRPPSRIGPERYLAEVRRAAGLAMLTCGLLTFAVYGLVQLTLAGFIVYLIPTGIAVSLAHRFAPRAVLWMRELDRRER